MESDLRPPIAFDAEVEAEAAGPPRSVGRALMTGGALGLAMSRAEPGLTRRERLVAAAGSAATLSLGVAITKRPAPVMQGLRRHGREVGLGCYALAMVSTAAGGGHRSPAFFPAVLATAVGAGIVADDRAGPRAGAMCGAGYLAGCAWTLRAFRDSVPRSAWWNVAAACGFVAAGQVGGTVGELSLLARSLSDHAARDEEAGRRGITRDDITEKAAVVQRAAASFLELLPAVQRRFEGDPEVRRATGAIATALGTLRNAELHFPETEGREELDLLPRLLRLAERHGARPGDVRVEVVHLTRLPPRTDGAGTRVLMFVATALVQNAAEARAPDAPPVTVRITLDEVGSRTRKQLRMVVDDDANGFPAPDTEWGTGLSSSRDLAHGVGGDFDVARGPSGFRVSIAVPAVRTAGPWRQPRTLAAYFEDARDDALSVLRLATAGQALFTLLSETERSDLSPRLARLVALLMAGEVVERVDHPAADALHGALAAVAASAFSGPGRPPMGGWTATLIASVTSRGRPWEGRLGAALAVGGATWVAGPNRFGEALPTTIGDRLFPLVGLVGGGGVHRGLRRLAEEEGSVESEAWLRSLLEDLVAPGRHRHHFLQPLREALDDARWAEFEASELGRRLNAVYTTEVRAAQRELESRLRTGDPITALQHQLARLLSPAVVRVIGEEPRERLAERGLELDRVSYRLGMIGLGEAVARRVRGRTPGGLLGRDVLREVALKLTNEREHVRIDVLQIPVRARQSDRLVAAVDDAAERAGGPPGGSRSGDFVVRVSHFALRKPMEILVHDFDPVDLARRCDMLREAMPDASVTPFDRRSAFLRTVAATPVFADVVPRPLALVDLQGTTDDEARGEHLIATIDEHPALAGRVVPVAFTRYGFDERDRLLAAHGALGRLDPDYLHANREEAVADLVRLAHGGGQFLRIGQDPPPEERDGLLTTLSELFPSEMETDDEAQRWIRAKDILWICQLHRDNVVEKTEISALTGWTRRRLDLLRDALTESEHPIATVATSRGQGLGGVAGAIYRLTRDPEAVAVLTGNGKVFGFAPEGGTIDGRPLSDLRLIDWTRDRLVDHRAPDGRLDSDFEARSWLPHVHAETLARFLEAHQTAEPRRTNANHSQRVERAENAIREIAGRTSIDLIRWRVLHGMRCVVEATMPDGPDV